MRNLQDEQPAPDRSKPPEAKTVTVYLPAPPRLSRGHMPSHRRGGAWKVAYADFVTALMALFIVLWLLNCGKEVRASVGGYFHDPRAYSKKLGAGAAAGPARTERSGVNDVKERIEQSLQKMPEFQNIRKNVQLTVTAEGLRIDLMENEQGMFFVAGSPRPTEAGQGLLRLLAAELGNLPNNIVVEGHTDARPFRAADGYSNWELSADRANAARRLMLGTGLRPAQVVQVRGFADNRLLISHAPDDARNRRVSVVVKFNAGD